MRKLVTIIYLTFIGLTSIVFFFVALLIWLLTVWWDRRLAVLHMFTSFWGHLYIWVMPYWPLKIEGREKLHDQPTVIVSNHQSGLDILIAFGLFSHFKWVSKAEMFKLPFIGWNMTLNRYIRILRGDKESRQKMMLACEHALRSGSSIYLFPEGTRSITGLVKEFKPGAFLIAHSQKVPIQPIVVNGTKDALPKHTLAVHGLHPMRLTVLDVIPYERFANLSIEATAEMVRDLIVAQVKEHQEAAVISSSAG